VTGWQPSWIYKISWLLPKLEKLQH